MNKAILRLTLAGLAASLIGCQAGNYRMEEQQQRPNMDTRGMKDEHYLEDRVNINIPEGGRSPRDDYDMRQNIRPGDTNSGNPQPYEGEGGKEGGMKPSTSDPRQMRVP